MTAKEFLWQYRESKRKVAAKQKLIAGLKDKAVSLERNQDERVQSSGGGDRQAQLVERYIDMERELAETEAWVEAATPLARDAIAALADRRERDVMECLYLDDMSLSEAAGILNFSVRWTKCVHRRALEKVEIDHPQSPLDSDIL